METKLDRGDYSDYTEASKLTLGDIAKRYIDGRVSQKKERGAIRRISLWTIMRRYDQRGELAEVVIKTLGRNIEIED